MIKWLFPKSKATAVDNSVAFTGDNNGSISINTGHGEAQQQEVLRAIESLSSKVDSKIPTNLPSDVTLGNTLEQHFDNDIDVICKIIKDQKQETALLWLTNLYDRVASTASGRIRFRILANMGLCHFLKGDNDKAAELLFEACKHAPNEKKSKSNKVFANILLEKWQEAYDYACSEMRTDDCSGELAGYMLQAASHIESELDPYTIVPETLKSDPNVIVGRIVYAQKKLGVNDWWEIATEGAKANPKDTMLAYLSAVAIIDKTQQKYTHTHHIALPKDVHAQIDECLKVLQKAWDVKINGEAVLRDEDIACVNNLFVGYLLTRNSKAIEIICEYAVRYKFENCRLMSCVANAALQIRNLDLARSALEKTNESPDTKFLKFQLAVHENRIEELCVYTDSDILGFPQVEQKCSFVIRELSKLKKVNSANTSDQLKVIFDLADVDARALIIIAEDAEYLNCPDFGKIAYDKAVQVVGSHTAERVMVAFAASNRSDWKQVIELLDGLVPTTTDSYALWILARAYSNLLPVTISAVKFFEQLPDEVRLTVNFSLVCGQMYYRYGDNESARMCFGNAYRLKTDDIQIVLALVQAMLRDVDYDQIQTLIESLNLEILKGSAIEKMNLASYLSRYGRNEDAKHYAYKALYEDRENPEVAKAYFELFMLIEDDTGIPSSAIIAPGYCFSLKSQHGDEFECMVADGMYTPSQFLFCNSHELVVPSVGLKIGDHFETANQFDIKTWTVTGIKHKFLHALHSVMRDFDARFTHSGLVKIALQDEGDIQPILDNVKNHSELQRKVVDVYDDNPAPLAFVAHRNNMDVVSFAELCVRNGKAIKSGSGHPKIFASAIDHLASSSFSKVVLDTYTVWRVAVADMFPLLKTLFSEIVIARSSLDEIYSLSLKSSSNTRRSSLSLSYIGGQYLREERTQEEQDSINTFINDQCDKIKSNCSVYPVAWDYENFSFPSEILDIADPHLWDAAYIALQNDSMLLSDDMHYRDWARHLMGLSNSTYTFALLKYLLEHSYITGSQYNSYLVKFSFWKHEHLFVSVDVLLGVLHDDTSSELYNFTSISDNIGGAKAEWISHTLVCKEFFDSIWQNVALIDSKHRKATAILLSKFFRSCPDWASCFLYFHMNSNRAFKGFLNTWRIGHMLPIEDLINSSARIRTQSRQAKEASKRGRRK
jgi:hypothetical protein